MNILNPFNAIANEYDQWFDDHKIIFLSELESIKQFMPEEGTGIEIGVGTGRFARALEIKQGVEPSVEMAEIARSRGIDVQIGVAEDLPYDSETFDFAIMVAVDPFVQNINKVYSEIFRILKPGGKLIVGILHKEGAVAQKYMAMQDSPVYRNAQFHTIEETKQQLSASGFSGLDTFQSLFNSQPTQIETPTPGHDKGSFVAIETLKLK